MLWRRSYDALRPPPPPSPTVRRIHDRRYAGVAPDVLPASERQTCSYQILPYWYDAIAPEL